METKLKLLSAGAVKGGVAQLAAEFERATGHGVAIDFAPAPELRERIAAGEAADAVILPQSMMDELATQGKVAADSRALLGRSRMGVTVHAAAPQHDLADTAAFKQLVLEASAVVYNNASSGIYAAKLLEKLGLAKIIGARIVVVKSGAAVMEYVAEHPAAAVGLAQISEIRVLIAKGCPVRLAAPLPDEIQNSTTYFVAATADAAVRQTADSLVRFLTTPEAKSAFAATGID
ncbi:MAG TPA: substrate-binding domain-containing protein [Burkholderiales bacterium]|nr:substrate-binding domain-containing protein [Burkholderiales bacterium]